MRTGNAAYKAQYSKSRVPSKTPRVKPEPWLVKNAIKLLSVAFIAALTLTVYFNGIN